MTTKTKTKKVPDYLKDTVKKYGDIIKKGNTVLQEKGEYGVISISPALDVGLGGGIREGCWLMLTGDPKSGKTTTAMQIAANCIAEGRKVIYVDAEGRLKDLNFQVEGLDPSDMDIIAPVDKPLSAELLLETSYKMLCDPEYHGAVLIIDSISSLISEKELDGDFSPRRAGLPKILSVFTKKVGQLLPSQRGLIIGITHYISNTSGFGKSKMSDGGVKIQYQADTRLEIAHGGEGNPAVKAVVDENGKQVGQKINWRVVCSSMGPPGGNIQSYIRYGYGIDKTQEVIDLSLDLGLIEQRGAWFNCLFMSSMKKIAKKIKPELDFDNAEEVENSFKYQGMKKVRTLFDENPELVKNLEKLIKESLL
jgi:recombination protein RecA|tara:strand:- start:399 stop:1493 length:1095 start_codon:yes stop_codon:yes gene_type:complete